MLGATNFSSQLNPFSQTHLPPHYPHGNFPSLHHAPQFQPNQQMLLNQHHHHHHPHQQQQIIQGPLSHDRVINSGQSGVFNSVIGPSDISTNTGLPDFNGQPKPLNHNNIMHGMSGSAFMLPHNLNILMKPSMFATNSQYNNFTTPVRLHFVFLCISFLLLVCFWLRFYFTVDCLLFIINLLLFIIDFNILHYSYYHYLLIYYYSLLILLLFIGVPC